MKGGFDEGYANEAAAMVDFDSIVIASGLFRLYREAEGYYLASRPGRGPRTARIDRILVPGDRLRAGGWTTVVGVEGKASDADLGPALSQAIDYTYAVYRVGSVLLYPEIVFLWPVDRRAAGINGAVESIMVQNRIGTIKLDRHTGRLVFQYPATHVLEIDASGEFLVKAEDMPQIGLKQGSR